MKTTFCIQVPSRVSITEFHIFSSVFSVGFNIFTSGIIIKSKSCDFNQSEDFFQK